MRVTGTVPVATEVERSRSILDTLNIQQTIFADGLVLDYERK